MAIRDLTGCRFGMLVALEPTSERKDECVVWRCRCDCGKEIFVSSNKLRQQRITSCGCTPKQKSKRNVYGEDLTGVQFGRWTVLYRTENRKNQTYWMCRCACGTERAVAAYCLKSGSSRSCGCLRKLNANVRLDIANKRFGRLVALFPTEKRSHGGSVYWHCRCDCGNEVDVTEGALISGGWKSCGCLKKEIQDNLCKSVQIIDHTAVEWLENRKHRRDNTTGFRGVYRTRNDRYYAAIGFKQRSYYLGRYDTLEEAIAVRLDAEHLVHDGFVAAYRAWQHKVEIAPAYAVDHPFVFDVQRIDGALQVTTSEPEALAKHESARDDR